MRPRLILLNTIPDDGDRAFIDKIIPQLDLGCTAESLNSPLLDALVALYYNGEFVSVDSDNDAFLDSSPEQPHPNRFLLEDLRQLVTVQYGPQFLARRCAQRVRQLQDIFDCIFVHGVTSLPDVACFADCLGPHACIGVRAPVPSNDLVPTYNPANYDAATGLIMEMLS